MRHHQWVKHIVVPVDVVPNFDSEGFTAIVNPDKLDSAELAAVFGCAACSEPLSMQSVGTSCSGADKAIDAVAGD